MGGEWRKVKLEEVSAEITVGYVGSMTSEYTDSGVPFLRSKNVDPLNINIDDIKFISSEFNEKIKKSMLSPGDVVIVRTGKPGTCAVIPDWLESANCSDLVIVRCGPELNNRYLSYYVNTVAASHVNAHLVGAVQQHFNVGSAKLLELDLPPLPYQEAVVGILGVLDDKIELNRQMNATLESMAQALFKSWFVDFDPVIDNALAAGNEIPPELQARAEKRQALLTQAASQPDAPLQPLPADLRALFPASFVLNEELGWVPEGWRVAMTEDVADKIGMGPFGSNIKVSTFVDYGIPIISGQHLNNTLLSGDSFNYITEEHAGKLKNSKVFPGDVIFTHAGNIGQVSLIPFDSDFSEYVISQRQFYLRPNLKKITASYLVFYFRSAKGQHELLSNASQVGVPSIARPSSHLKSIVLLIPPLSVLNQFDNFCNGIFKRTMEAKRNSDLLTKGRDSLLPKLLSGQIQLPEAEQQLSEAI